MRDITRNALCTSTRGVCPQQHIKSDNFVGNIERGESTPSLPTLIDVANALNVGTDTLLQDYLTVFDSQQGAKPQHPLVYKVESMTAEEQKTVWAMIDLMMQFKNN